MLRWVIVLLVLANAGYFVWTQGHLAPLGLAPVEQSEPERLQAQIKPEALRLLNGPKDQPMPEPTPAPAPVETAAATDAGTPTAAPNEPAAPSTTALAAAPAEPTPPPAPAPRTACWQAGGFSAEQADALRTALAGTGLPPGSWRLGESKTGGRWVVYMGRYSDEQLDKKKSELQALGVSFRALPAPLGPGLALGTYSSEEAAQLGLQDVTKKGVRTARVVQERAEGAVWTLRLPAITDEQRNTVAGLRTAMAGKRLQSCE